MKIKYLLLLFVFVVPLVVSGPVSFDFPFEDFSQKESAWVHIHFEVDLTDDLVLNDVLLLNSEDTSLPFTKKLIKVTDHDYFVSFIIPSLPDGEYYLALQDISYVFNEKISKKTFKDSFNISHRDYPFYIWDPVIFYEFQEEEKPKIQLTLKTYGKNNTFVNIYDEGTLINSISPGSLTLWPNSLEWLDIKANITDYSQGFHTTYLMVEHSDRAFSIPIILKKKWYTGPFVWDSSFEEIVVEVVNESLNESVVNETLISINESVVNETIVSKGELSLLYPINPSVNLERDNDSSELGESWIFKNTGNASLSNITVKVTGNVAELINYSFVNFSGELLSGAELGLDVSLNFLNHSAGEYTGDMVVGFGEDVVVIPFNVVLTSKVYDEVVSLDNVSDEGEVVNYTTGDVVEEEASSVVVIVLIVVLVLVVVLFLFVRKGKKKSKENFGGYLKGLKR